MNKRFLNITLAFLLVFVFVAAAGAEEAKPAVTTVDSIKNALGMSLYLQAGYTYNFKNPDSQENELRVFDHKANSFTLDLAQLQFAKDAPVGGIGFKVKISAGETAKLIHSTGLGNADNPLDLTEAYISYLAPIGKGLRFDLGKFVTYHGAEVIEAKDNINYSRSLLFNYAIPFTHTGLKVCYTFSDAFNAGLHLVNGWDNTSDNNKGKTIGFNAGYTPMEQLSMVLNLMYGPEKNNSSDNRFLFDWVGTFKPVKNMSFILNADYATEKNSGAKDSKWSGLSGIAKYEFNDHYSLALRAEYFKDEDGVRTGTSQTLKEITLTPEIKLAQGIILRPEYRHDWSDKNVFASGSKKAQDTFALGVMYTW